jgi:hypothetical protein
VCQLGRNSTAFDGFVLATAACLNFDDIPLSPDCFDFFLQTGIVPCLCGGKKT